MTGFIFRIYLIPLVTYKKQRDRHFTPCGAAMGSSPATLRYGLPMVRRIKYYCVVRRLVVKQQSPEKIIQVVLNRVIVGIRQLRLFTHVPPSAIQERAPFGRALREPFV